MSVLTPARYLYVFLDEGGDFNFSPSGTKFFTLTTLCGVRPFTWDPPLVSLKYNLIETGLNIEYFHAAEDRQAVRDRVFGIIAQHLSQARFDSLIIEKRKTGPALQVAEKFYPRMIGYLLQYVLHPTNCASFDEVIVITDSIPLRSKRQAIGKAIKVTLAKMLPDGVKYSLLHHASKSCISLQVVDYCNWALFRKWERGDSRSYDLVKEAVRSEFDIFRSGTRHYY